MPLGHAEEAILRVVSSKNFVTIAYIQKKIDEAFGGGIAPGAIYTTLHRLKPGNYVLSTKSPPLPERGGKCRNVYSITAKGLKALEEQECQGRPYKGALGRPACWRQEDHAGRRSQGVIPLPNFTTRSPPKSLPPTDYHVF